MVAGSNPAGIAINFNHLALSRLKRSNSKRTDFQLSILFAVSPCGRSGGEFALSACFDTHGTVDDGMKAIVPEVIARR
ncbi:hypothetical protein CK215_29030 [Mesorhizobium sp. WSM3864]|uniref:hypothetical protein n=1 Tax=Mesorhizobium sp. WSM3864 TaxID=2029404 RepID=UPI000BD402A4|nr:hypothetical protein [Mesorhizobium sp. WSM3864]PBB89161.1 hypothetical protein CK215_29030 [Mesorhizobium sp. WSM3864]